MVRWGCLREGWYLMLYCIGEGDGGKGGAWGQFLGISTTHYVEKFLGIDNNAVNVSNFEINFQFIFNCPPGNVKWSPVKTQTIYGGYGLQTKLRRGSRYSEQSGTMLRTLVRLLIHRAFSVLTNRRADMTPVISNQRRIFLWRQKISQVFAPKATVVD